MQINVKARAKEPSEMRPRLDPSHCFLRHITSTARAIVAYYDPLLRSANMSGHQFNLLMTLARLGPLPVGQLARQLGMDASGVPRAAQPLTKLGWVETTTGTDRRVRLLAITRPGRSALNAALPLWEQAQARLLEQFGDARWLTTRRRLRNIRNAASR